MTKEYHIDCNELAHFDEYKDELYVPGPSCAIRICNVKEECCKDCETWELLMSLDLDDLGIEPGERVWIEIDY